jgi:hypothetical protein
MRTLTSLSAGLIAVAGALAVAVLSAPASAAPPVGATLTLDPASGKGDATITATFQVNAVVGGNCRLRVTYRWDNRDIGQARSNSCTSTVRFKAPSNARGLGPHQVTAVDATRQASAVFTITATDASPTPTHTGRPTPTAAQSVDAAPLIADTGQAADPSLAPVRANALPTAKSGGSAFTGWVLAFGGVLVLGGVVILILVVLRMRRGEPDAESGFEPDFDPEPVTAPPYPLRTYPTHRTQPGHLAESTTARFPRPPEMRR